MTDPVILKLNHGVKLTAADHVVLTDGLVGGVSMPGHTSLIREGDAPDGLIVVLKGLVCRYKNLRDGERQIVALMAPGDFCDVHAALLRSMDHGLTSLGASVVATVPRRTVRRWMDDSPTIRQAMNWAALVDEAILREWLVNIGARRAPERMAHLFCEMLARLQTVCEAGANSFTFPLTQEELAQTLGLSVVHVNRTLGFLRSENLASFKSGVVRIPDVVRLSDFAGFTPEYLHLTPMTAHVQ